jgi:hypothetical protein
VGCSYRWLEPRHGRLALLLNSESDVVDAKGEGDSSKVEVARWGVIRSRPHVVRRRSVSGSATMSTDGRRVRRFHPGALGEEHPLNHLRQRYPVWRQATSLEGSKEDVRQPQKVRHAGVEGHFEYTRRPRGGVFPSKLDVASSSLVSRCPANPRSVLGQSHLPSNTARAAIGASSGSCASVAAT